MAITVKSIALAVIAVVVLALLGYVGVAVYAVATVLTAAGTSTAFNEATTVARVVCSRMQEIAEAPEFAGPTDNSASIRNRSTASVAYCRERGYLDGK